MDASVQFHRIPTKASRVQTSDPDEDREEIPEFQVVVHKKRQKVVKAEKTKKSETSSGPGNDPENPEFDIKRARHDVIRFGASGLDGKEKKNAQVALAVKLGAKPPKGTAKSYKEYQDERRAAKLKDDTQKDGLKAKPITHFHPNQLISTALRRKRKRKDEQNMIGAYGRVGMGPATK